MSEQTAVTEPVTIASAMAAAESSAEGTTAPAAETSAATTTTEAPAAVEQAESPTYQVKVGGETFEVSLEEALAGYQRQADYTQKTQAVAAEREQLSQAQQLWDAIEANPQQTISKIAEAYGFKLTAAQEAAAQAHVDAGTNPFEDFAAEGTNTAPDPRWERVESFIAASEQRQMQEAVNSELAAVHAKYGVKFNDSDLVQFAVDRGISSLDDAFKAMSFDAAQKVAQDRKSKQAVGAVAPGHTVAAGTVVPSTGNKFPSLAEAFAAAEAEQAG